MANSNWLPALVLSAAILTSVAALLWQGRRARFHRSLDLLLRLESDFFGPAKMAQRVKAARGLLAGQPLEAEPILDFFETMALLLRRGALDEEIVWNTFFYWVDNYYEATKDVISLRQQREPEVWEEFVVLVATLRNFQTSTKGGRRKYNPPTRKQVADFLAEELTDTS
jgi:hypothetical protein